MYANYLTAQQLIMTIAMSITAGAVFCLALTGVIYGRRDRERSRAVERRLAALEERLGVKSTDDHGKTMGCAAALSDADADYMPPTEGFLGRLVNPGTVVPVRWYAGAKEFAEDPDGEPQPCRNLGDATPPDGTLVACRATAKGWVYHYGN